MPAKLGKSTGRATLGSGGPAATHLRYADVNGPFPRYYFPAGP